MIVVQQNEFISNIIKSYFIDSQALLFSKLLGATFTNLI